MKKNPLLKKSKEYVENLVKFIGLAAVIVAIVVIVALSVFHVITVDDFVMKFLFALLGFLLPIVKNVFDALKDSTPWETYLTYLMKKENVSPKEFIRTSYAASVIIEIGGKYLLLKNPNGLKLYGLPSRTYSITKEEEARIEVSFGAIRDDFIRRDYSDYRFLVPIKNVKRFYQYFCEHIDPYQYSYQGIIDDVVAACGFDAKVFEDANVMFRNRRVRRIAFSRYTGYYEMNVMDVCLLIPTPEQEAELLKMVDEQQDGFRFETLNLIKSNGVDKTTGDFFADISTITYDFIMNTEND